MLKPPALGLSSLHDSVEVLSWHRVADFLAICLRESDGLRTHRADILADRTVRDTLPVEGERMAKHALALCAWIGTNWDTVRQSPDAIIHGIELSESWRSITTSLLLPSASNARIAASAGGYASARKRRIGQEFVLTKMSEQQRLFLAGEHRLSMRRVATKIAASLVDSDGREGISADHIVRIAKKNGAAWYVNKK